MVPDDDVQRPRTAPGVSLRKHGAPGVSLRKPAAPPPAPAPTPPPAATPPPMPPTSVPPVTPSPMPAPGAARPRRSRAVRAALVAVAAAAVVLGLAKPAHLVLDAVAVGIAAARSAGSDAQPVAEPAAAPAEESASAEAPPSAAPTAAATLDGVPLASMLLGSDALPAGITIDGAEPVRAYTLDAYRDGYTGTMTPAGCARLRGIMAFRGETDAGGTVIRRADDLRFGEANGSQQVRRFPSAALAAAFLDEQRAWFANCGVSRFEWPGHSVEFDGTIDADDGDVLLASANDLDSDTGVGAEFDGWVRRGDVVFGAYLIGTGADRAALRQAGAALVAAAEDRLAALG